MSHYALVVDGVVQTVIVAEQDFIDEVMAPAHPEGQWLQTSYNTFNGVHYDPETRLPSPDQSKAFRKNFAAEGYTYDAERDAFIPPKEYPSWIFDEDKCDWVPPVARPTDGQIYFWDEETQNWFVPDFAQ